MISWQKNYRHDSIVRKPFPVLMTLLMVLGCLIKLSLSISLRLVERHDQTRQPTPEYLRQFVNYLRVHQKQIFAVTKQGDSALTSKVVAVKTAKVTVLSKSKCTFCLMSM